MLVTLVREDFFVSIIDFFFFYNIQIACLVRKLVRCVLLSLWVVRHVRVSELESE